MDRQRQPRGAAGDLEKSAKKIPVPGSCRAIIAQRFSVSLNDVWPAVWKGFLSDRHKFLNTVIPEIDHINITMAIGGDIRWTVELAGAFSF